MDFEWDAAKEAGNEAKHGVPFGYAVNVFLDPQRRVERSSHRQEHREVAYGMIDGRLYVVVFTRRRSVIRIISARKGNKREQKKYRALQD